jgi:mono/diheme cytochrome c family protein
MAGIPSFNPPRPLRLPALLALAALAGCAAASPASGPEPQASVRDPEPPTQTEAAPSPTPDPYHPAPRDTVPAAAYDGWKQYSLHCARCHGEEAQGTSFAPSLLTALKTDGSIPSQDRFATLLSEGRASKGMPSAGTMGLDSTYFAGLYQYLKGRSDGVLHGGRPARRPG